MLSAARRFFEQRAVLEVDTPFLSPAAVSDPHIESVRAELRLARGAPRYLHTSPEYFMKRLLCAGYPDIFQIAKVFRDDEAGPRHRPEFTLIEWYRRDFAFGDMIEETAALLTELIEPQFLAAPPCHMEYGDAMQSLAGVDWRAADTASLATAAGADARVAEVLGEDRDGWLDLLMTRRIAPGLARDRLTVLRHYPAGQAALARICPNDGTVADRFEIFLGDLELANGFVELRDSGEQRRRFEADLKRRRRNGQPVAPLDERFLAALQAGLPPCAGVAAGLDRLLMINERTGDIRRVQTFAEDEIDE